MNACKWVSLLSWDIEEVLEENNFLRVHRQYIINLHHVKQFNRNNCELTMITGETLPIAKNQKERLTEKYKWLWFQLAAEEQCSNCLWLITLYIMYWAIVLFLVLMDDIWSFGEVSFDIGGGDDFSTQSNGVERVTQRIFFCETLYLCFSRPALSYRSR